VLLLPFIGNGVSDRAEALYRWAVATRVVTRRLRALLRSRGGLRCAPARWSAGRIQSCGCSYDACCCSAGQAGIVRSGMQRAGTMLATEGSRDKLFPRADLIVS